jgi:hypothetical protein
LLEKAGWQVQDYRSLNFGASLGVAVREFPLKSGPADYLLFVDRKPVVVVEAKPEGTPLKDKGGVSTPSEFSATLKHTSKRSQPGGLVPHGPLPNFIRASMLKSQIRTRRHNLTRPVQDGIKPTEGGRRTTSYIKSGALVPIETIPMTSCWTPMTKRERMIKPAKKVKPFVEIKRPLKLARSNQGNTQNI